VDPCRWIVTEGGGLIEGDENIARGIYWPLAHVDLELRMNVDDEGRADGGEQTSLGTCKVVGF